MKAAMVRASSDINFSQCQEVNIISHKTQPDSKISNMALGKCREVYHAGLRYILDACHAQYNTCMCTLTYAVENAIAASQSHPHALQAAAFRYAYIMTYMIGFISCWALHGNSVIEKCVSILLAQ